MNSFFSNAEIKFSTIDGVKIAYRNFGSGFPVLVYNRFRGILDTWDPLFLDSLATNNTVVIFDYPGIGDSEGELSSDILEVAAHYCKCNWAWPSASASQTDCRIHQPFFKH
ncbi:alpha/beta fold hydrolase [Sphingobacterium thalpophilum]|uniref:alpha/beta fold hydrolase n=1 Tax=Sphingobacterium thalpophilum TaxID=259 RepID=UPI0024A6B6C7|nr:hypothetical protein [Sphingobacterium thalpophilum]